jgi:stearoyl-CoA desaturase (Delta-9 desaturase)
VPPAALLVAGWLAWGGVLHWADLVVLAITYTVTGLGITVGYHRLFTHRSFQTTRVVRALFAVFGAMAVEGPLLEWVATHRKHHRFSDQSGDPHSPHLEHGPGWRATLRGLGHAHLGWMLRGKDMANPARYAKDLVADRDLRLISKTFPLWVIAGLAMPFGLGVALTGSLAGGLTGLLWGGAVRIFLLHHATFSINSLCHYFGRRPFSTADESRNLAWLADRLWRGLAQQPPRVPHLRASRTEPVADRPRRLADHRTGALPPGLGRHPHQPPSSAVKARR